MKIDLPFIEKSYILLSSSHVGGAHKNALDCKMQFSRNMQFSTKHMNPAIIVCV